MVLRNNAIPFMEKHINILNAECLKKLSRNPFAVDMLERHIDKISWNDFVNNPNGIHIVEKFRFIVTSIIDFHKIDLKILFFYSIKTKLKCTV